MIVHRGSSTRFNSQSKSVGSNGRWPLMGVPTMTDWNRRLLYSSHPNNIHYPQSLRNSHIPSPFITTMVISKNKQGEQQGMNHRDRDRRHDDPAATENYAFEADFSGFYNDNPVSASPYSKYASKEAPLIIFGQYDFVPASSSLTDSEEEEYNDDDDGYYSAKEEERAGGEFNLKPKTEVVSTSDVREEATSMSNDPDETRDDGVSFTTISSPFAQLLYDPEKATIRTVLQVKVQTDQGIVKSKRLRVLDPRDAIHKKEISVPPVQHEVQCRDHTTEAPEGENEPIFQLGEAWLEETDLADLDLYLLHEFGEPWENGESRKKCTDALKKLILAPRALAVFRDRTPNWETTYREPPQDFNYTSLGNHFE